MFCGVGRIASVSSMHGRALKCPSYPAAGRKLSLKQHVRVAYGSSPLVWLSDKKEAQFVASGNCEKLKKTSHHKYF